MKIGTTPRRMGKRLKMNIAATLATSTGSMFPMNTLDGAERKISSQRRVGWRR